MNLPTPEIVALLTYLLPGFITAALVHSLTPFPRSAPFERVVQALIYTIIVQFLVIAVRETLFLAGNAFAIGPWSEDGRLAWSVIVAVVLGVGLAYIANHDSMHSWLRRRNITYQTSYSSEWFGAFSQNLGYIVLHLKGDRRLLGWAEEWPNTASSGHFVMSKADWLDNENTTPLEGVAKILVRAEDVEMVELMFPDTEYRNEAT